GGRRDGRDSDCSCRRPARGHDIGSERSCGRPLGDQRRLHIAPTHGRRRALHRDRHLYCDRSVIAHGVRLLAVFALALASGPADAGAARKPVALMAAPARVVLAGTTDAAVRVANSGTRPVVVDVSRAGFALTLRGRPRIVRRGARSAASWLKLRPTHLVLPARTSAPLLVSASVPRKAEPG